MDNNIRVRMLGRRDEIPDQVLAEARQDGRHEPDATPARG